MKRLCIHCGSSSGNVVAYQEAAKSLATLIAHRSIELVYGGASVGLMGLVADAALAAGGRVIGIMPEGLFPKEISHAGLSTFHSVPGLHERKKMLVEISDAFITLPGGLGTMDEFMDVLLARQLRLHKKPCGLLNVRGFFDPVIALLDTMIAEGFLAREDLAGLIVESDPEELLRRLETSFSS